MQLQQRLDETRSGFESRAPKPVLEIMHRATEDLRNSGILERAVKIGDKAPDFELANTNGESLPLSELTAKGPVILCFYRGRW